MMIWKQLLDISLAQFLFGSRPFPLRCPDLSVQTVFAKSTRPGVSESESLEKCPSHLQTNFKKIHKPQPPHSTAAQHSTAGKTMGKALSWRLEVSTRLQARGASADINHVRPIKRKGWLQLLVMKLVRKGL